MTGGAFPAEHEGSSGSSDDRQLLSESLKFPVATAITAPSRFMKAAASELLCGFDGSHPKKGGIPSRELIQLYKKFARGGFGVLVTGKIMISPDDIEAPGSPIINKNIDTFERRAAFQEWANSGKENGTICVAELFHPGKASSDYTGNEKFDPGTVSKEKLEDLLDQFIYAGTYASSCGFDGVELHCASEFTLGYLITQNVNQRTDEYGGTFENRTRAIFKIIDGIRKNVKDNSNFLVGIKLGAANLAQGFFEDELERFVKQLEDHGVDFITLTDGRYELLKEMDEEQRVSLDVVELAYRTVATTVKDNVRKAKIFMDGCFTSVADMSEAVRDGWTHGICIAGPEAAESDFVQQILFGAVSGALKSMIQEKEYPTPQQTAGTQLWQYGSSKLDIDPSSQEYMEQSKASLGEHQKDSGKDLLEDPVAGYTRL